VCPRDHSETTRIGWIDSPTGDIAHSLGSTKEFFLGTLEGRAMTFFLTDNMS
jgi:hypothetical protein